MRRVSASTRAFSKLISAVSLDMAASAFSFSAPVIANCLSVSASVVFGFAQLSPWLDAQPLHVHHARLPTVSVLPLEHVVHGLLHGQPKLLFKLHPLNKFLVWFHVRH